MRYGLGAYLVSNSNVVVARRYETLSATDATFTPRPRPPSSQRKLLLEALCYRLIKILLKDDKRAELWTSESHLQEEASKNKIHPRRYIGL